MASERPPSPGSASVTVDAEHRLRDSAVYTLEARVEDRESECGDAGDGLEKEQDTQHGHEDNSRKMDDETGNLEGDVLDDIVWAKSPENPWNWSWRRKWRQASVVSLYTFVSPLASSMIAPGLPAIAQQYHITNATLTALPLSIFILAYAAGPLIFSPFSEMYGRKWVLHGSNILFLVFNLISAWAPNTTALIIFRFFAGLGGSTPVAIGGSVISDSFPPRDRAAAMAIYTMGPLMGPVVGPVAGGFVAETIGFKWVFIIVSILSGAAAALGIFFLSETYHPVLRARLAKKMIEDNEKLGELKKHLKNRSSKKDVLWINMSRPFVLFCKSFILFILGLFMAIEYGFMYLMFTTFPELFPEVYGFSVGITGLCYLGLGVGFFISTIFGATVSNKIYLSLADRKNGGVGKPEYRIPTMLAGSVFVPVGLFWFGWSAQAKIHWIMPIIGSGFFGVGVMLTFLPIQLYLVDSFTYAASALSAAAVMRALFGFGFPLFATQMFNTLTIGGGYSLLAGLAIVIGGPFPIWIYLYGERIRAKSSLMKR